MSLIVDAIAPTNFIATNPAALRKLAETKGASVIRGVANFVEDLTSGTLLPRQVDARPFKVGQNLAATPGAVVFRNEVLELIQYAPTTPEVHERPLLIVPPQINKYYVFDLAPAKSIVQWSLGSGVQTFAVSWRNPTREHADWGIDAYVAALAEAVDAMREITGSADVNVFGACSGGITLAALLGYLAARRRRDVHAATLAVCVLDTAAMRNTTAGLFVTPATIAAAKAASRRRGVVEGTDLARMFAWMRPNDLIWNYVVNNYLLGNEPPGARHPVLEQRYDASAGAAARRLPRPVRIQSVPRPGQASRARQEDRPRKERHRYVCRRRPCRSHHRVAGRLPHRAVVRQGAQHVRRCRTAVTSRASSTRRGTSARGSSRGPRAPQRRKHGSRAEKTKDPGGRIGASGFARAPAP